MEIKGRVWCFGNDVDTDVIIPARYLNVSEGAELARHVMEDADPEFSKKVAHGDIIVAGKNFGCGSSREHAPLAIKVAGVSCVIATSFARIFYRNAINIGLPIFEVPGVDREVNQGDEVVVDADTGQVTNITSNKVLQASPFPPFMQELIKAGGLMPYVAGRVKPSV